PGLVVYAQYVNVLDAFGEFYSDHPFRLRRLIQDIFTGTVPDGPDQVVLDGRTAFLISSLQCHLYLFWLCGGLLFSLVGRWCLADGAQRIPELLGVASQKKLATRMAARACTRVCAFQVSAFGGPKPTVGRRSGDGRGWT